MKISHSAVTSSVYELVKVIELDLRLGDEFIPLRFEIFQDTERKNHFRCRLWQLELHRLQPTFPMDEKGQPEHIQDAVIILGWIGPKMKTYDNIVADDADIALAIVMDDFKRFLEHVTLEKAQ